MSPFSYHRSKCTLVGVPRGKHLFHGVLGWFPVQQGDGNLICLSLHFAGLVLRATNLDPGVVWLLQQHAALENWVQPPSWHCNSSMSHAALEIIWMIAQQHVSMPAYLIAKTYNWLVVTGTFFIFPEILGMSSSQLTNSQLTNSYFSDGLVYHHPDTPLGCWWGGHWIPMGDSYCKAAAEHDHCNAAAGAAFVAWLKLKG